MECLHCNGNMIKATAPFSIDRNGYHITWESIPAWVCMQCGEPFFEEHEAHHLQMVLQKLDHETTLLTSKAA
uniref:YgiT-type zinc finger domain-containing protein n=1 Tax=Candidatus Kentrum sp. MB TaxID=2138164 RepID=A0A450XWD1_9GAMM|nr:MAG: YgiT-type zinc finger domain-containing protein [Candidatus Kentron sp. MB]VFK33561.1 MAG: YgiT-type zinc finger domain-containing protein [Candidatus Kentron sp. MB]VFK76687.1 MAG: YgiT-type zinc finger domain-containing protein [Candidatus Kentron sp. MB]